MKGKKGTLRLLSVAITVLVTSALVTSTLVTSAGLAEVLKKELGHLRYLYPVVRVTSGNSTGSGTVIYSKENESGKYSTYVLTNYHVIASSIRIATEWDSNLKKDVKIEKRSIVYVELFKYRELSIPIGTLKVEADVVIYSKDEDTALLKLRLEDQVNHVAKLYPNENFDDINIFDETVAVGCSLAWPPLPTVGYITRKGFIIDSLEFWMSSSQIIYGNSGGAMFLADTGELIGIPSRVALAGWSTPITHMGLFIPIYRVYNWLGEEYYSFIWDSAKTEKKCLELRELELEEAREKEGN